jgi:hypothetical protein
MWEEDVVLQYLDTSSVNVTYYQAREIIIKHSPTIELMEAQCSILPFLLFLCLVDCPKTSKLDDCALLRRVACHQSSANRPFDMC